MDPHELTIRGTHDRALVRGRCRCGWESADYGIPYSVRRAHAEHLETVRMTANHEVEVSRLLKGTRPPAL